MKSKYIIASASILLSISASAMSVDQPTDTVLMVKNANSVVITENPSGINLTVRGTDKDPDFVTTFTSEYSADAVVTTHQRFTRPTFVNLPGNDKCDNREPLDVLSGMHAGFVGTLGAPTGVDVEMGKSYEIGIDNIVSYSITPRRFNSIVRVGIGVNWRNWRMTGNTRFVADEAGVVSMDVYPEGCESRYSRVKIFSLSFPVMLTQFTNVKTIGPSKLAFKFGAILNWNSHASVESSWRTADGTTVKEGTEHIGQRKFSVDVIAAVRFAPSLGLYLKYSPMKVFKTGYGPEFSAISTGLYFSF